MTRTRAEPMAMTLGLVAIVGLLAGCDAESKLWLQLQTSDAKLAIERIENVSEAVLINGELDYGVAVHVTIRNVGRDGWTRITTRLSTSEGEWSRRQVLQLAAGTSRQLKYVFHEPTINTSNVQSYVTVEPGANSR
jgi:hypothetical protein